LRVLIRGCMFSGVQIYVVGDMQQDAEARGETMASSQIDSVQARF
jgi:hypothetical protein